LLGTTLAWFAHLLERQSLLLNNLEAFIEKIGASFGKFHKKCITTSKLQALR